MKDQNLHLVKAAFHAQFKSTMVYCGVEPDKYFHRVGLPVKVDDPEDLLPEKPFWRLINMVALEENIPDFGARVARTKPWHQVESLIPWIQDCDSLQGLLGTFCDIASSQSSNVVFDLKYGKSICWFRYSGELVYQRDVQMELYRATSMIEFVQLATGVNWRPTEIYLSIPETRVVDSCELLTESSICFSKPVMAIAIDRTLMDHPVSLGDDGKVTHRKTPQSLDSEFVQSISNIVRSYIPGKTVAIEDIARIADLSVRTLQRRLANHGLKFNDLLNQIKFEFAKQNLQQFQIPIRQIAEVLGYSDAAHFNRAFHRWSGISPSGYRKKLKANT